MRVRLLVALLTCVGLLAGCSEAPGTAASVTTPTGATADAIDPQLLEPLTALGPCESPPPGRQHEPVTGLVLPEEAVVTTVERADPVTSIQGYVAMTPVQMRVHYERAPQFREILIEDEIHESEVLVTDGEHRLFVKTQAVCELGSIFVAVVAPEQDAERVPVPTGPPG